MGKTLVSISRLLLALGLTSLVLSVPLKQVSEDRLGKRFSLVL